MKRTQSGYPILQLIIERVLWRSWKSRLPHSGFLFPIAPFAPRRSRRESPCGCLIYQGSSRLLPFSLSLLLSFASSFSISLSPSICLLSIIIFLFLPFSLSPTLFSSDNLVLGCIFPHFHLIPPLLLSSPPLPLLLTELVPFVSKGVSKKG